MNGAVSFMTTHQGSEDAEAPWAAECLSEHSSSYTTFKLTFAIFFNLVDNVQYGTGSGASRHLAREEAARNAIATLRYYQRL
jgi:dsRNA-specific ribonuclease